jgi:glycosyltransferase involved in cell wall biosynthesis
MKILIVSQYFWPEQFRINDLVSELVARGHEVTVLTGKPNYPTGTVFPEFTRKPNDFRHYKGANVIRLPMLARGKGSLRLALNYLSFALAGVAVAPFKLHRREFDVIFVCLLSPVTSALPALMLRQLRRIPAVLWVLDLWPQSLQAVGVVRSARMLALVGKLVGFIYHRSDLVLGQSQSFLSELRRYLTDERRIGYLPGWNEQALASSYAVAEPAPEVPVRSDLFTIVFTGNIGEAQDFPAILDAACRLRDRAVRWVIVGDGRKADWVRAEVARRGLSSSVLLPGRFSMERMPTFYRHADALLVSLKADPIFAMTIPGKVQAYLAAGRPILAMLDGEGAEVIRAADAGYAVPSGDAAGLARGVERLMETSPAERSAIGERGRAYAKREFDRSTIISRLEQYLEEVVRAGASPLR